MFTRPCFGFIEISVVARAVLCIHEVSLITREIDFGTESIVSGFHPCFDRHNQQTMPPREQLDM